MAPRWIPLESNPDMYTNWAAAMGVDTSRFSFHEIFGFDPDILAFVPQPVLAVVMLFPVTEPYEKARAEEDARIKDSPTAAAADFGKDELLYSKQTIGNACGTMGLLHALTNSGIEYKPDSPLDNLIKAFKHRTPIERAQYLETCQELESAHQASVGGQTEPPSAEDSVELHFCAFVQHKGHCVELDGRKNFPIDHGEIKSSLLEDVAGIAQEWMELSKGNPNFNLVALCEAPAAD